MEHFSIQEVRAADWANLKLACIEVNKQIAYALKAARFKSAQTVPLSPILSRSPFYVSDQKFLTVALQNGTNVIEF
jgi:hypothetical protein